MILCSNCTSFELNTCSSEIKFELSLFLFSRLSLSCLVSVRSVSLASSNLQNNEILLFYQQKKISEEKGESDHIRAVGDGGGGGGGDGTHKYNKSFTEVIS